MQVCNRGLCSFVGTGTSVVQKQKKGLVPLPPRCLAVGRSEQGFHFSLIKIADRQARSPFEWNRPDLAAPFEMLWTVQTDEVRQGADGSQPLIACPHITIAALFRVEQELTDSRRENFIHSKLVGGFVSFVGDGPNDKTKGISVAPLRVETQVTHADEEFQKEPSYPRTEESGISHGRPPSKRVVRSACWLAPGVLVSSTDRPRQLPDMHGPDKRTNTAAIAALQRPLHTM